ncbi:hypothetical protein [[Eubacterium] cellulosolvens]
MAGNIPLAKKELRKLKLPRSKNTNVWIAVISSTLLLMATVATAFCVFQATLWTGKQAIYFGEASAHRIESVRASNNAIAQIQIDAALFVDWATATSQNNTILADFLEERFREEFRPAFYAWLSLGDLSKTEIPPGTPFELTEYQPEEMKKSQELLEKARESFAKGSEANEINDRYISSTVMFAIVLFLTGIEPRWQKAKVKIAMTVAATIIFTYTLFMVLELPRLGL